MHTYIVSCSSRQYVLIIMSSIAELNCVLITWHAALHGATGRFIG